MKRTNISLRSWTDNIWSSAFTFFFPQSKQYFRNFVKVLQLICRNHAPNLITIPPSNEGRTCLVSYLPSFLVIRHRQSGMLSLLFSSMVGFLPHPWEIGRSNSISERENDEEMSWEIKSPPADSNLIKTNDQTFRFNYHVGNTGFHIPPSIRPSNTMLPNTWLHTSIQILSKRYTHFLNHILSPFQLYWGALINKITPSSSSNNSTNELALILNSWNLTIINTQSCQKSVMYNECD